MGFRVEPFRFEFLLTFQTTINMANQVNTLRHMQMFDAGAFGDRTVDVIGAGAVGSKTAMLLAKLGLESLRVWDADEVESHNIANQAFGQQDIGRPKVEALADRIERDTGLEIDARNEFLTPDTGEELGHVVYLMVDSMEARRTLFEGLMEYNFNVGLVVEVRMGPDSWRVYSFNPSLPDDIEGWKDTLYTDEEAVDQPGGSGAEEEEEEEGGTACNVSQTVGPTSSMLAGHATWQLLRYQQNGNSLEDHNEQVVGVPPLNGFFNSF